ncbi:MAG: hypothetical protein HKN47_00505 [Pirellulaceae bacterium]|nr:hypothetical protein [Pirellulaceae bacterium]
MNSPIQIAPSRYNVDNEQSPGNIMGNAPMTANSRRNFIHDILHLRLLVVCIAIFGFLITSPARAEIGELHHYRGDWMIDQNRAHLAAVRRRETANCLELRFAYQRYTCPRWVRGTWIMQYDADANSYTAVIGGKKTRHASGNWNGQTNTMTWSIAASESKGIQETPNHMSQISHVFDGARIIWTTGRNPSKKGSAKTAWMQWDLVARPANSDL